MTVAASDPAQFGFGHFLGSTTLQRRMEGFEMARLVATVPEREVAKHTHLEGHFVLVLAGTYLSSAAAGACGPAALIYNPPGTTHRDCFRSDTGTFLTISVARDTLWMARDVVGLNGPPRLVTARAVPLALQLARACSRHPMAVPDPESLCFELLALAGMPRDRDSSRSPAWLARAREELDDRWNEPVLLREVAAAAGVHPIHFTRVFRRHFRQTPGEYLRARRVDRSLALLTRSQASLADIALACGFADQSHFTKVFSRVLAIPPGEYRRLALVSDKTREQPGC